MIPFLDTLPDERSAIAAIRAALRDGLDPEAGWARSLVPVEHGQMMLMPAEWGRYAGIKVGTVAPDNPSLGLPRIQGMYMLLDGETLAPLAIVDGATLTISRTAAVSALAVDLLASPDASCLVVFGTGPQARGHVAAIRTVRPIDEVIVVGRSHAAEFASSVDGRAGSTVDVARAHVVVCATTARTPLFNGGMLQRGATVVAVGSHEPNVREVDDRTVCASTVVVEARSAALREAGDVVQPLAAGVFDPNTLVCLAGLVRGEAKVDMSRPRLFKSVGMAWEDLVIAATGWENRP
ncbi:ornithine cyclodeaminase family protein [Actinophytocola oryzae]|uniref:Ornithine cyclodeaminase n=1 Tax=Actinophytocola oryzae TaxID=502181 RepID=A0A4R7W534_9PSEU|nr:ornithine cyclodeaminase family protein [Actinophytocola oryzae]TDV57198.1 ornithine cyclodeaminase [Actinophytocola oryzae]